MFEFTKTKKKYDIKSRRKDSRKNAMAFADKLYESAKTMNSIKEVLCDEIPAKTEGDTLYKGIIGIHGKKYSFTMAFNIFDEEPFAAKFEVIND